MNKTKRLIFSFFISAAIMNTKLLAPNYVHAAAAYTTPNVQSSAYSGNMNIFTKYGYKGQCTWFTYGRVLEKLGISLPQEFYGNAVDWWYANVRDNVYSYGSEPKANSIAVWGGGNYGYGHVAFVESVDGDTVSLNEGNFNVRLNYDGSAKQLSKEEMENRGNLYLKGYIYIGDSPSKNTATATNSSSKASDISTSSTNSSAQPLSYSITSVKQGIVNLSDSSSILNVRNSASSSSDIVGHLNCGQVVNVVGSYGDWYKIQYNSSYAYVSSRYIKMDEVSSLSKNSYKASILTLKTNSDSTSTKTGVVQLSEQSSSLNLRSNPNGAIISSLPNGTKVNILGSNNGWLKVNVGNQAGYVSSKYINTSQTITAYVNSQEKVGTVTLSDKASTLNLRLNPWTGRILSSLSSGSKVQILGSSGRWYKVKSGSTIGYVHSDYISL